MRRAISDQRREPTEKSEGSEVGTSNSSLSVGKSPQLLREQKFSKLTPR